MITEKSTVTFHYVVAVKGEGVIESTYETEALTAELNTGNLIPALEQELIGLKAGDKKSFDLETTDTFGEYDEDAVTKIPKTNLELRKDIKVGMFMDIEDQNKNEFRGRIVEIDDESVTMDFNHPLAGKALSYDIEVISVK